MYQFYCYTKCTTCQKARRWLDQHQVPYQERPIKEEHPTAAQLQEWVKASGREVKSFFNTSGLLYKEFRLKERLPVMTEQEQLELLASDGMLLKRPLLVGNGIALSGFKEEVWSQALDGRPVAGKKTQDSA